jgi:two-component system, chemotaxis family, protein-glutamate methylesterase/glutaminase
MSAVLDVARPASAAGKPIRVMVVDDAMVPRRLLTRWIGEEPDMVLAACVRSGSEAVERIAQCRPDIVILDIDMPELDGLSALPLLLEQEPDAAVIMVSTLTCRGAEVSVRALLLGAADYIAKPEAAPSATAAFRRELMEKIRTLGLRKSSSASRLPAFPSVQGVDPAPSAKLAAPTAAPGFALRPFARAVPRALLIGSSTGGPQALSDLFANMEASLDRAPVLIAQHMPPAFTTALAAHLARVSGRPVHEAEAGEAVVPGGIYVAPGGRHMRVARGRDGVVIAVGDDPPINFCKPSVDALLCSAAEIWGGASLALILTGMGSDGTRGAAAVASAGGSVMAQDEASSAVWGMPRAVAEAGWCSAILPLDRMAATVNRLLAGELP